jgi:putative transposase
MIVSKFREAGRADFNDRGVQVRPAPVPAQRDEAVIHPSVAANSARSVEGISVL